jgi:hypothetical protein
VRWTNVEGSNLIGQQAQVGFGRRYAVISWPSIPLHSIGPPAVWDCSARSGPSRSPRSSFVLAAKPAAVRMNLQWLPALQPGRTRNIAGFLYASRTPLTPLTLGFSEGWVAMWPTVSESPHHRSENGADPMIMWAYERARKYGESSRRQFLHECTSDLSNYPREETGGARLARRIDGAAGNKTERVRDPCRVSDVSLSEAAIATTAHRFWHRLCQTDDFSPPATQILRLQGEDSSLSARMACKSSLAEITGKSRTRTQPRTHRNTSGGIDGLTARTFLLDENLRRHNK